MSEITEIEKVAIESLLILGKTPQSALGELVGKSASTVRTWRKQAYQASITLGELKAILSTEFYPDEVAAIIARVHIHMAMK